MTTDIDLSGITLSMSVIPELSGSFSGQSFAIHNLTITGASSLGLIGTPRQGAEVRDLGVVAANVAGTGMLGGGVATIVGDNYRGDVLNCYSSGTVNGIENVGGLVGSGTPDRVSSSFGDIRTSGQVESAGGTGLTTTEMMDINTYLDAGWDFVDETKNGAEDIWWILEGQDYIPDYGGN